MKKLNITKEHFEKSNYFMKKYGKLEYVSESGKLFKTNKGKLLKFKESSNTKDEPYSVYKFINTLRWDYNEYMLEEPKELEETGDGWKQISIMCSKSQYRKMLGVVKEYCQKYGWEYDSHRIDEDVFEIVVSQWDESTLTDDYRESTKKFGKKFAKESSTDDMEKEFTYKGISITRYDYESLPSPMAASKFSDEQMQEIAKDIYFELVNRGWDEKEIQKYVNNVDDYELPDAEMRVADKIRSDWWEAMEDVARYHGMEYYEDMDDEALVNESDDGSAWFDTRGDLLKSLPGACIMACAGQGRVDDDVDFWTRELGFDVGFPVEKAAKYLQEYGAWEDLDLLVDITKTADRKKMSEWFRTNGNDEDLSKLMLDPAGFATKVLAHRVLWIFCNDLKELAYEMMDDETSLVSDWGDPSTWGDDEWERFQKEYSYCSLNN